MLWKKNIKVKHRMLKNIVKAIQKLCAYAKKK